MPSFGTLGRERGDYVLYCILLFVYLRLGCEFMKEGRLRCFKRFIWAASSEKLPLIMEKMCKFTVLLTSFKTSFSASRFTNVHKSNFANFTV